MLKRHQALTCAMFAACGLATTTQGAHDDCTGAINAPIGSTIIGSTVGATIDGVANCGTTITSPGVWYWFTGDGSAVEINTCHPARNYDTKLSVYQGSCAGLICVTGNDDFCGLGSRVRFCTTPGETYFILVHGFGGASGDFGLNNVELIPPQPDDVCNAQWVPVGSNTPFDNRCATVQPGEVTPGPGTNGPNSCLSTDGWCDLPGFPNEPDIDATLWYTFTAPCGGVQIGATGQDYQIAVWEVGDCSDFGSFNMVAANDDRSGVNLQPLLSLCNLTPGQTYYIQVDSFDYAGGPDTGPGTLSVHPIICNDCNNNNVDDECDIANGNSQDCNNDGIPDECQLAGNDCNGNLIPDDCEVDCNNNGIPDDCDIANNTSFDCNCNGVPDECDILNGLDVNGDGFVDSCVLCAGDTNCDGVVNYVDMINVWANIGTSGPLGDVNYDGTVNFLDYFIVAWNYGSVCN